LGRDDAFALAASAANVIVAKGKKVSSFTINGKPSADIVDSMLGPTGNLRAPTMQVGKTVVVGFQRRAIQGSVGVVKR
jgi:hypothetical protein